MSTNLVEFLIIAGLVTGVTTLVSMFRYTIIVFERRGREEIERRQPEWDALAAQIKSKNESS
jgi:hypothetical protein|tara:strand:+ start:873 stop:1058 length:186 start_codon:yes stop_codon:yes gene_type:complete